MNVGEETTVTIGGGTLPMRELVRRTGVSESTLRSWERRYGLLEPERTAGGHRRYRTEDLERISHMRQLLDAGWSTDVAAAHVRDRPAHPESADKDLAAETAARVPEHAATDIDAPAAAAAYQALLRLCLLRDPAAATHILRDLVHDLGGTVVLAADSGSDALPFDLSFGEGPPVLPEAPAWSVARMRLQFLLPEVGEAARRMVDLVRGQQRVRDGA